jgi:hypothetical protein
LGSRPQAQMTITSKLKTILALEPFKRTCTYPIMIAGNQVFLEKVFFFVRVMAEARFPDFKATDPKFQIGDGRESLGKPWKKTGKI